MVRPVCQSSVVAGLSSQFILLLNMFRVPANHFVHKNSSKTQGIGGLGCTCIMHVGPGVAGKVIREDSKGPILRLMEGKMGEYIKTQLHVIT